LRLDHRSPKRKTRCRADGESIIIRSSPCSR
jgi:hypothetical protein